MSIVKTQIGNIEVTSYAGDWHRNVKTVPTSQANEYIHAVALDRNVKNLTEGELFFIHANTCTRTKNGTTTFKNLQSSISKVIAIRINNDCKE